MTDCNKCKEYDNENNYCPVFCNVINDTLADRTIETLENILSDMDSYIIDDSCKYDSIVLFNFVKDLMMDCVREKLNELKEGEEDEEDV